MRDRNNFDYTRSADGDGYADLKRVAPTEENIRPVHYGESDVGAMRFSSAPQPQPSFDGGRAPEQQSFIPNNYGAPQNAYAAPPTNFGGNSDGFGGNAQNGYNGNGFGGSDQNNFSGNGFGSQPSQGYNAQPRSFANQPLQTSERPLVFKNKRVEGQYIYEYRDRLEIYRYTGLGMIYEKTFFKNGY